MNKYLIVIFVLISIISCSLGTVEHDADRPREIEDTLVLVHTLFRHGDRTPDSGIYANNPYSSESFYMPYGFGQLTNVGKQRAFTVGKTLRKRYNHFLGPVYNIKLLDARTTNTNRTKMSLQLMLAGLWPPKGAQVWMHSIKWQPIPYNYFAGDKELFATEYCSTFRNLYKEALFSDNFHKLLYTYKDVFEYVSNHTGKQFRTPDDIFALYIDSVAQVEFGYPVEPWMQKVFPKNLLSIIKDTYYILSNTTALTKIAGGYLLRKIINDSKAKMDGLLVPQERQMFIYCAHEYNVAGLLMALGVFDYEIPAYGSYVLIELHKIGDVYGFKVFYNDWTTKKPHHLTIPGCAAFCPYDEFVKLLAEVIPADDDC